jgi:hypothetical protein
MKSNKPKITIDITNDIETDNLGIETIHESISNNIKLDIREYDNIPEDTHFTLQLNKQLHQISENFNASFYAKSNYINDSPITLSPNNSDSENESSSEYLDSDNRGFHKLSRVQIESTLDKYYYEDTSIKHSNELDILITYLKGQKNLYIQAKNISQFTLNALLIPSLLITSSISIFAPFIQDYIWSGGFISGLNAASTLLITLVNYLKLESSIDIFHNTANQYDKLETGLEFISSKLLYVESNSEKTRIILEKIEDTERKICDIKEWNTIFVPEVVRAMFPVICNINIFSLIKRMETYKKKLILKFKDVKNEIRYILYKRKSIIIGNSNQDKLHQESRLTLLLDVKEKIKEELMYYKNAYEYIDDVFIREIKDAQDYNLFWSFMRKPRGYKSFEKNNNPIVDKYLNFIFSRN